MITLRDRFDFRRIARWGGESIVNAVFPHRCLACDGLNSPAPAAGCFADRKNAEAADSAATAWMCSISTAMGSHICRACLPGFLPVKHPICTQCGKALQDGSGDDHLCGECIREARPYRKARSLCVYDRTGLSLVHALKYRGKIQLAGFLGDLLYHAYLQYWPEGDIDAVVPVPLHRKRFRQRGFNQAYLLVCRWPDRFAASETGRAAIDRHSLVRRQTGKSQTGLNRSERIANVRHAFSVADPEAVDGKRLLLIDDVYTTGATANACARILLKNGAASVDVLTLARAMQGS